MAGKFIGTIKMTSQEKQKLGLLFGSGELVIKRLYTRGYPSPEFRERLRHDGWNLARSGTEMMYVKGGICHYVFEKTVPVH